MSDLPPIRQEVKLDTTDYKTGAAEINRNIRVIDSGFKASAAALGDWSKTSEGLELRMKSLSAVIELQKQKVANTTREYERLKAEKGENAKVTQDMQIKVNKEIETLNKLQVELGQTTNSLKKVDTATGGVKGAFHDLGTKVGQLGQQVPALGTAFSLLTNPLALSVGLITGFAAATDKSIKKVVEYNKNVRDMMLQTGLSAEETSRLIQVADDWQIEIGEARSALEMMNKRGYTPSIDLLADLADQYAEAGNKTLFIEEATKKYGKTFGTLLPILSKGGDALRDQAASINEHMLATDESIQASREYEEALDNFRDAVDIASTALGNRFLPLLTKATKGFGDLAIATIENLDAHDLLVKLYKTGLITQEQLVKSTRDLRFGTKDAQEITTFYYQEIEKLNDIEAYNVQIETEEAIRRGEAKKGMEDQIPLVDTLAEKYGELAPGADLAHQRLHDIADAAAEAKRQEEELITATENLMTAADNLVSQGLNKLFPFYGEQIKYEAMLKYWRGEISLETYQLIAANSGMLTNMEKLNEGIDKGTVTQLEWMAAMADGVVTNKELKDALEESNTKISAGTNYLHDYDEALDELDGKVVETTVRTYYEELQATTYGGKRHQGGPVTKGVPYIVEDEEVFVPNMNGMIIPLNRMGGLSSHTSGGSSGGGIAPGNVGAMYKVEVVVKIEGGSGLERESARAGVIEAARQIGLPL